MSTPKAAPEKLLAALQACRAELGEIEKTGENKFHGYKFVQAEELFSLVRPILQKNGIWIFPDIDMTVPPRVDEHGNTHITFLFWICHESGERLDLPLRVFASGCDRDSKGTWGDKGAYKANTGAWKYLLLRLFTFDSGEHEAEQDEPQTAAERVGRPIAPLPPVQPIKPPAQTAQDAPGATKAPAAPRASGARASKADVKAAGVWKAAFRKAEEHFGDDKDRKYMAMNWALEQVAIAEGINPTPRSAEDLPVSLLPLLLKFIGLYAGQVPGPPGEDVPF